MTDGLAVLAQTMAHDTAASTLWLALRAHWSLLLAVVLGGVGVWLMLPPAAGRRRVAGGLLAAVGLGLLAGELPLWGEWVAQGLFWFLAGVTLASAVATISMRSPVYSALWFASTLLGTAGLFLLQGAQLVSVATVIVYAGAIVVTFLFVLMLAQPEGHAFYDRISWGPYAPALAVLCGGAIVGGLTFTVSKWTAEQPATSRVARPESAKGVVGPSSNPTPFADSGRATRDVMPPSHMAKLGSELFSRHLLSVEAAGTLLLVTLVGAIAIVIHSSESRTARAAGRRPPGETSHG